MINEQQLLENHQPKEKKDFSTAHMWSCGENKRLHWLNTQPVCYKNGSTYSYDSFFKGYADDFKGQNIT